MPDRPPLRDEGSSADAICEFDGHEWGDAGGGLLICLRCEAERWAESPRTDCQMCGVPAGDPCDCFDPQQERL